MKKKELLLALVLLQERVRNNALLTDMLKTNLLDLKGDIRKLREAIEKEK